MPPEMASKKPIKPDPVRELFRQTRTLGLAVEKLLAKVQNQQRGTDNDVINWFDRFSEKDASAAYGAIFE